MKPDETMERRLDELADAIGGRESFVDEVMSRIKDSPVQFGKKEEHNIVLRRILMRNKIKFAAAAIIVFAAVLALTVLDQTVAPTYALEQTIEALHSVRTIHLRGYRDNEEVPISVWAEFSPDGSVRQIRLSIPVWDSPEDGPKEIVWKNNAAQVWLKEKNILLTVVETKLAEEIQAGMEKADPKRLMQKLDELSQAGKAQLEIEQPDDLTKQIRVTATFSNETFDPILGDRLIAEVDQATKLAWSIRIFKLTDTGYEQIHHIDFYDYNQPIDAALFSFDNLPADVVRVDQAANPVGLEQGQMSDDEAAMEVVRRFWQAVIASDYATAGQMYDGLPGEKLRIAFEEKLAGKTVSIVSVGPVQTHPKPETQGLLVPCVLEVKQADGQTVQVPFEHIGVRQVYNQPGRWTIFGGL